MRIFIGSIVCAVLLGCAMQRNPEEAAVKADIYIKVITGFDKLSYYGLERKLRDLDLRPVVDMANSMVVVPLGSRRITEELLKKVALAAKKSGLHIVSMDMVAQGFFSKDGSADVFNIEGSLARVIVLSDYRDFLLIYNRSSKAGFKIETEGDRIYFKTQFVQPL